MTTRPVHTVESATAPISTIFLCHGLILGGWATQVPILRDRLGLLPGTLGAALFCASAGAVAAMPAASNLVSRYGVGRVIRLGAGIACTAILLAVSSPGLATLCASLTVFGVGYGVVDVAMNAHSVQVERAAGRKVLGFVHAMWSVGAFAGSAGGALLLRLVAPGWQAAALSSMAVLGIIFASYRLGEDGPVELPAGPDQRPWRDRRLLLAGGVLCLGFAVEGAVADWSGIYLRGVRHVPTAEAALGYSAFSLSMVAMRLAGDALRGRIGNAGALFGAFGAALGLTMVLVVPGSWAALAGFALAGAGVANVVPAVFAQAGIWGGADPRAAVGVVATLGYAGVLAGPPLFGAVAQATSLSTAIALIAGFCCAIAAGGAWLRSR